VTRRTRTDGVDRRAVLGSAFAAGAAGLAGCLGDGDDQSSGDDSGADTDDTGKQPDGSDEASEPETELPIRGEAVPTLRAFDELLVEFVETRPMEAGALGIAKDGQLVFERGYGWGTPEQTVPVDPTAKFRIGSVSKSIALAAIRGIVDGDELGEDDPVLPLLGVEPPGSTLGDDRWAEITVGQLAAHRGGFDSRQRGYDPMYAPVRIADALGLEEPPTKYDITRHMLAQPLQFDPGSRREYSNFGYALLGQVVETVTDTDYQRYLEREVFDPAGVERIEPGRTRPEDRPPGEIWYTTAENSCPDAFELDPAPEHDCPDVGFVLEAFDAVGEHIASTSSLLAYLGEYWLTGQRRGETAPELPIRAYGSHPGSYAFAGQYADGVDVVALFNGRELPVRNNRAIADRVESALSEVDADELASLAE